MPYDTATPLKFSTSLGMIKSFLCNSAGGWVCVGDTLVGEPEYNASVYNGGTGTGARTIYLQARGYDGTMTGVFALYSLNSGSSYYTIAVRGIREYHIGRDFSYTGYASSPVYMPTLDSDQPCTISADERSCWLAVYSSGRYCAMHFGYFLPSGLPTEYPLPMIVGGTTPAGTTHVGSLLESQATTSFWSPSTLSGSDSTLYVLDPTYNWVSVINHSASYSSHNTPLNPSYKRRTLPYAYNDVSIGTVSGNGRIECNFYGSSDKQILPIVIDCSGKLNEAFDILGEMDGIYYISGIGTSAPVAGDVAVANGSDLYLIWHHLTRSGGNSYAALRLKP